MAGAAGGERTRHADWGTNSRGARRKGYRRAGAGTCAGLLLARVHDAHGGAAVLRQQVGHPPQHGGKLVAAAFGGAEHHHQHGRRAATSPASVRNPRWVRQTAHRRPPAAGGSRGSRGPCGCRRSPRPPCRSARTRSCERGHGRRARARTGARARRGCTRPRPGWIEGRPLPCSTRRSSASLEGRVLVGSTPSRWNIARLSATPGMSAGALADRARHEPRAHGVALDRESAEPVASRRMPSASSQPSVITPRSASSTSSDRPPLRASVIGGSPGPARRARRNRCSFRKSLREAVQCRAGGGNSLSDPTRQPDVDVVSSFAAKTHVIAAHRFPCHSRSARANARGHRPAPRCESWSLSTRSVR